MGTLPVNIKVNRRTTAGEPFHPSDDQLIPRLIEKGTRTGRRDGVLHRQLPRVRQARNANQLLAGSRGGSIPATPRRFTLWKAAGEHRRQVGDPWGPSWAGTSSARRCRCLLGERFTFTPAAPTASFRTTRGIAQSEGVTSHQVVGCWLTVTLLLLVEALGGESAATSFGSASSGSGGSTRSPSIPGAAGLVPHQAEFQRRWPCGRRSRASGFARTRS
jgi:hypothetical protein